jgi:O-antigen ligase
MLVQTLAMLAMAAMASRHERVVDRMFGVGSMFDDPNDLALNLCIVLPFCVAMLFRTRNPVGKVWWTAATLAAFAAIVATGSRGGFLALLTVIITMRKRFHLPTGIVLAAIIAGIIGVGVIAAGVGSSSYLDRMHSIVNPDEDKGGSAQSRRELLIASLALTVRHPLLGVGPGQFGQISGSWHETHNTYTQFSSEAGIPALLLFLAVLRQILRNLRPVNQQQEEPKGRYIAAALYCGTWAYIVGAFFLPTTYWFTQYLLVAYAAAARQLASAPPEKAVVATEADQLRCDSGFARQGDS